MPGKNGVQKYDRDLFYYFFFKPENSFTEKKRKVKIKQIFWVNQVNKLKNVSVFVLSMGPFFFAFALL